MKTLPEPVRRYLLVYAALLLLLAATVGAIYIHLGAFNIVITLAIAAAKALLVVFFFMHIRLNAKVVWVYAALGIVWISFLMGGTLADVLSVVSSPTFEGNLFAH